jgi:hypothetical protein
MIRPLLLAACASAALSACSVESGRTGADMSQDMADSAQRVLDRNGYDIDARTLSEGQVVRISGIEAGSMTARQQIDAALAR